MRTWIWALVLVGCGSGEKASDTRGEADTDTDSDSDSDTDADADGDSDTDDTSEDTGVELPDTGFPMEPEVVGPCADADRADPTDCTLAPLTVGP